MKLRLTRIGTALAAAAVLSVGVVRAQVTPAAGYTPPDDTPKINVGITLFANYSYQDTPKVADASPAKTCINPNSFDVTRAYINVTGSLSHWFSFRITPDITRETGTGSSLSGSQFPRRHVHRCRRFSHLFRLWRERPLRFPGELRRRSSRRLQRRWLHGHQ